MSEINKEEVLKTIIESEQVKNLTNPITKRVGIFFDDIFTLVFGGWSHELAEKSRIKHERNIENFKESLKSDLNCIPEENRILPKESIVGPALEASKYYFEESEIRDMFEKLIASSMDSRKATKVHPSFTEIIKQLSPLDAQNLKLFKKLHELPIVEYHVNRKEGYNVSRTNVFLENPDCQDINIQAVSVAALERVGLVTISFSLFLVNDDIYRKYEENPFYISLSKAIESFKNDPTKEITETSIKKGKIKLTPLGETFIDVCLSDLPE